MGEFATEEIKQTLIRTSLFCLIPTSADLMARETSLALRPRSKVSHSAADGVRKGMWTCPAFPHTIWRVLSPYTTLLYLLLGLIVERIQIDCIFYFWNFV